MLMVVGFMAPPWAHAHATYVRSEPPSGGKLVAPGRIGVFFSEDVDPSFSEVQVLDSNRRQVDRKDTRPVAGDRKALTVSVPDLPDGTYTVAWRTLSAVDGHTVQGAFPLVVGEGGAVVHAEVAEALPHPLEVVLRALTFIGSLLLAGGLAFRTLVLGSPRHPTPPPPFLADLQRAWERRFTPFALVVIAVLLASSALSLALQIAAAADVPIGPALGEPMLRYLGTRNGIVWSVKAVALVLLAICFSRASGWLFFAAAWGLTGAFMLGTSLTSHAAALARGGELAASVDWLHQVGAAGWLGSLATALLVLPDVLRAPASDRRVMLGAIVPRLSALATASVILLVASGIVGALLQVGSREAFGTLYGAALAFKISALAPMLALGALNKWFFTPRFAEASGQRAQAAAQMVLGLARRFRFSIAAEIGLGAAVLVATGVLTSAEPAREVWGRQPKPLEVSGTADDLDVRLRVEPGSVGENTYLVVPQGQDGAPARDVQRVQLRFSYVDQVLGRGTRTAEPRPDGAYSVAGNDLSIAGRWQVDVVVRRLNREDAVGAFLIDVGAQSAPNGGSAIALPRFSSPYAQLAIALLAAGLVGLAASWLGRDLRWARPGIPLGCAAITFLAGFLALSAADFSRDLRSLRNPLPMTEATTSQGKGLYAARGCGECHGETGRGDGPLGIGLRPQPADFRVHMAAGHTDGQIFDWLSNGVPGTAMPGFGRDLSEQERWLLINYIRSFASEG